MTDNATSGTEHLMLCIDILEDLSVQLLGDPAGVIGSIRRSGIMAPLGDVPKASSGSFEDRERAAQGRIDFLNDRRDKREAVRRAITVIQGLVRDLSKSDFSATAPSGRL
jgi:hypothetical protein